MDMTTPIQALFMDRAYGVLGQRYFPAIFLLLPSTSRDRTDLTVPFTAIPFLLDDEFLRHKQPHNTVPIQHPPYGTGPDRIKVRLF